jgi:hypothetical protein
MSDVPRDQIDLLLLKNKLAKAKDYKELTGLIVNEPFKQKVPITFMFLGFIVLIVVNKKTGMLDRVSITKNELAQNTFDVSSVPFEDIKIPLEDPNNLYVRSIKTGEPTDTTDWYFTFTPALTGEQARINQASAGIAFTVVYPLKFENGGCLSFSYYQYLGEIGENQRRFMSEYTDIASEAMTKFFPVST